MTKEEAMEILKDAESRVLHARLSDALKLAIEALKEERPHGEWLKNISDTHMGITCSICGRTYLFHAQNFCPNCGADMRKEGEAE